MEIHPLLCSHLKRPLSYDNVETARVMAYTSVFTRVMDYTGTGSSLGLRHRERERGTGLKLPGPAGPHFYMGA